MFRRFDCAIEPESCGIFGSHVSKDAKGEVVETREGIFESYATVKFDNGYTEEVKASDLDRHSWW
jgi:hypothetical protein